MTYDVGHVYLVSAVWYKLWRRQENIEQNWISGLDFHYKFNSSQIYPQMVGYKRLKKKGKRGKEWE